MSEASFRAVRTAARWLLAGGMAVAGLPAALSAPQAPMERAASNKQDAAARQAAELRVPAIAGLPESAASSAPPPRTAAVVTASLPPGSAVAAIGEPGTLAHGDPPARGEGLAWLTASAAVLALAASAAALLLALQSQRRSRAGQQQSAGAVEALQRRLEALDARQAQSASQLAQLNAAWNALTKRQVAPARTAAVPADAGIGVEPRAAHRAQTPPAGAPRPGAGAQQPSEAAITSQMLGAIEKLAHEGTQITEANAPLRIGGACTDRQVREFLQSMKLPIRFFTAAGSPGSVNAELMAWCFPGSDSWSVVPHPSAGRIGQFNKWFSTSEYATHPVLVEVPAIGVLEPDGRLAPQQLGSLR
jgi:hypothetical protein